MKKLLFIALLLSTCSLTYSQWIASYGNTPGDVNFANAKGNSVTVDAQGNCYVTGYSYEGTSQNDIIVLKYGTNGAMIWARSYNGNANMNDEGFGICVDNAGNVYIVGFAVFTGKSSDVVLLKYNSTGDLLWANQYSATEGAVQDKGAAIAVDLSGNIYITGYTTGSDNLKDVFTRKCNSSGAVLWTKTEDGLSRLDAEGNAIAVGPTGNVFITGYTTSANGTADILAIKYNSFGETQWVKEINGSGNAEDKAWGIVVEDTDNAYITGYVTESTGAADCYTAKLNTNGSLIWSKTYNGTGNNTDKAWGIVVDSDGSAYITGETTSSSANINYVTIKYNNLGSQVWSSFYNGTGNGEDKANSIAFVNTNVVVTGQSWGTTNTYDYATVRYNKSNGGQTLVNRYSFSGETNDVAKDVATRGGKIIVTGYSELIIENSSTGSYVSTLSVSAAGNSEMTSETVAPVQYELDQNFPNPFNPSTNIKFSLAYSSSVKLIIYDMLGRQLEVLVNQHLEAGTHNITFNAGMLSSGIYFYKLEAGSFSEIKKMTLVK